MMLTERQILIQGADWTFSLTTDVQYFHDEVMAEAMVMPMRDIEIGFPFDPPVKRGEQVTITIPQWEFSTRAKVTDVDGRVVRLREVPR